MTLAADREWDKAMEAHRQAVQVWRTAMQPYRDALRAYQSEQRIALRRRNARRNTTGVDPRAGTCTDCGLVHRGEC